MTQCIGVKPNGDLCKGIATRGSDYCPAHDPARKEARHRNAKKAARSKPSRELISIKARLATLAEDVLAGEVETGTGAVVSQILNVLLRAISVELKVKEQEQILERVEELEALMDLQ